MSTIKETIECPQCKGRDQASWCFNRNQIQSGVAWRFDQDRATRRTSTMMSSFSDTPNDLVVLNFDGADTAADTHNILEEHLVDLDDTCVVSRGRQDTKLHLSIPDWTKIGGDSRFSLGKLIGILAGLLILNPLAGLAKPRQSLSALEVGSLAEYGINDDFLEELGKLISVDSSTLFLLVKGPTAEKVISEMQPFKPRLLKVSLPKEKEEKLRLALMAWRQAA